LPIRIRWILIMMEWVMSVTTAQLPVTLNNWMLTRMEREMSVTRHRGVGAVRA